MLARSSPCTTRHARLALALLCVLAATAPADAGWWGSRQGCIFVGDPDYMPRNFVRRPYYVDRMVVWFGPSLCHLTRKHGDQQGLSGVYDADCGTDENGVARRFSLVLSEAEHELTMSWIPLAEGADSEPIRIGPLRRCFLAGKRP